MTGRTAPPAESPIPVTIIAGTLGAGKTTTIEHILDTYPDDLAVLVNDVGDLNVDAEVVSRQASAETTVEELSSGCICCDIQGAFDTAIIELAREQTFDALLVEPSGIAEPKPVAERFARGRAAREYDIASVTTVIDTNQLVGAFDDGEIRRRGTDGDRPLSDLLVDGLEFCDTVICNKTDRVTDGELSRAIELIRTVQPSARIIETTYGQVAPDRIVAGDRFNPEAVAQSATWKQAIEQAREEKPDATEPVTIDISGIGNQGTLTGSDVPETPPSQPGTGETGGSADGDKSQPTMADDSQASHQGGLGAAPAVYNVDSVLYERRRPFHPERLHAFLSDLPSSIVRAKGYCHIAGHPDHALLVSVAGQESHVSVAGRWIASLPPGRQEHYRQSRDPDWDEEYGDRHSEIVVIGQNMEIAAITDQLDACLLTADEAEPAGTDQFPKTDGETTTIRSHD